MTANPATRLIYHPQGRAGEFAAVACNPYKGCGHGCKYCYVPMMPPFPLRADFHTAIVAREFGLIDRELTFKATQEDWTTQPVTLAFTCDPYQPLEKDTQHTRAILAALKRHGFAVNILTKNPALALRDAALLDPRTDKIGTTLTTMSPAEALRWEPGCPLPEARATAMERFRALGFFTWISLEPVITATSTAAVIDRTAGCIDHYKAGLLNYAHRLPDQELKQIGMAMNRRAVAEIVVEKLEDHGFTACRPNTWGKLTYMPKETFTSLVYFPNLAP